MAARPRKFGLWKELVDATMRDIYGIDTNDAGIEDERLESHWRTGERPDHFVAWFGEKYDLFTKRELGIEW